MNKENPHIHKEIRHRSMTSVRASQGFSKDDINRIMSDAYFKVIKANSSNISLQSKNSKDYWLLFYSRGNIVVKYRQHLSDMYTTTESTFTTLSQVKRHIVEHDLFVMNDYTEIDKDLLEYIIKFYIKE